MYAKLRVYLHEQMDMVGHDFHLYDVDVVFAADFLYEFLQAYIDKTLRRYFGHQTT